MRTYEEVVKELKDNNISPVAGSDFYDFTGLPLEDKFRELFNFCQEFLDRDDLEFDIKPARFFYNNKTSVNALANVSNGFYYVEIFKGSIFWLHDYYMKQQTNFDINPALSVYDPITQEGANISASHFLFQFSTLFFLYHETGHLIQRTTGNMDYIEFLNTPLTTDQVRVRHIREHDADWFGVNQIVFHLLQLLKGIPNDQNYSAKVHSSSSLMLAGIFMYFINSSSRYDTIYYEEKSHPHPSVRLAYTLTYMLETLAVNLQLAIDQNTILRDAIQISEALLIQPDNNVVETYSLQILNNADPIETYINTIRHNSEAYQHLARKVFHP